jgi:hypothetical protein
MPKRRPNNAVEPLDIFSSPRLGAAMAAATSPEPILPPAPATPLQLRSGEPEEARYSALRTVPEPEFERTEAELRGPVEPASAAHETPSRPAPKSRKGRAAPVEEPEPEPLPESNVPLKFRVPQTLRSDFQTFKAELSAVLGGVALDDSNLGRPLLEHFLLDQRERILEAAGAFRGKLRRPANGDAIGMAEFDHLLGEIFGEARRRRRTSPTAGEA